MRIKRRLKNDKFAVSVVIGVVLLVAVSVSLSGVVLTYVTGMTNKSVTDGLEQNIVGIAISDGTLGTLQFAASESDQEGEFDFIVTDPDGETVVVTPEDIGMTSSGVAGGDVVDIKSLVGEAFGDTVGSGEYTITCRNTDEIFTKRIIGTYEFDLTFESNNPPNTPSTPDGLTPIFAGYEHEYCTSTNDPENHDVFYRWDWGDGDISEWDGPYNSGDIACASHAWDDPRIYEVRVKAKDDPNGDDDPSDGLESLWSDPLYVTVSIPGDLNHDGKVDQSDLGILLADWGCTGGGCPGDINGDGNTDQSDLGILLAHWGEGT